MRNKSCIKHRVNIKFPQIYENGTSLHTRFHNYTFLQSTVLLKL